MQKLRSSGSLFFCKLGEKSFNFIRHYFHVKQFPFKGFIFLSAHFGLNASFMVAMNVVGSFFI